MVSTLLRCNGLQDALQVFHKLPHRTVFSWTAIISRYALSGQNQEALTMYKRMLDDGVQPDTYTFVSLLKACGNLADLREGRRIHAEVLKYRCDADLFVRRGLVDMYGKCGSISDAWDVFDGLPERSVVSWNVILAAYTHQSQPDKTMQLYAQMQDEGVSPNGRTLVSALQACGILAEKEDGMMVDGQLLKVRCLQRGQALHGYASRKGYASDVFVGSTLVSMYGKCGSIMDARNVFKGLSLRTVVSWNILLAAYVQQGEANMALELYKDMREEGVIPNNRTFIGLFQACAMLGAKEKENAQCTKVKSFAISRAMHADAWSKGFDSDVFIGSALLSMYGKCGSVSDAKIVFDRLIQRDVVLWNAMLGLYSEHGQAEKALQLFEQMHEEGLSPDGRTFVSVVQACGMLAGKEKAVILDSGSIKARSLGKGKAFHAYAGRKGYASDVFVESTLVGMYGKCGSIADAQNVFNRMSQRNVVAWTTMLIAYVEQAQAEMALQLYQKMCEAGVSMDAWIFVSALQACGMAAEKEDVGLKGQTSKSKFLEIGKGIHADARSKGCDTDIFVGNTLVSMYGKCGSTVGAWDVFDGMSQHDVVSWNAMLRAYAEEGSADIVLQLYDEMQEESVTPDSRTFVSVLQACAVLAEKEDTTDIDEKCVKVTSLMKGKAMHAVVKRMHYDSDIFVASTLTSMYGKCGSITDAQIVFSGLSRQDLVSWNVMLAAYIEQDAGEKALELYEEMLEEGLSPDIRSLVSALQACGLLAGIEGNIIGYEQPPKLKFLGKGKAIHADASSKGHDLDVFVGNTLVSMYGKCGSILDAETVFDRLAERNLVSWNAMLASYAEQGQSEEVLHLYEQMSEKGVSPDAWTFVSVIRGCCLCAEKEKDEIVYGRPTKVNSLDRGKAVHFIAHARGYDSDVFVGNTLVSMYGKCGSLLDAHHVFDGLSRRDVVSWNALLTAFTEQGQTQQAFHLYDQMKEEGVRPDVRTFVSLFQSCGMLADMEDDVAEGRHIRQQALEKGKAIHAHAQCRGFELDVFVGSALVAMYGKCRSIVDAHSVFSKMSQPDVVLWNAMLMAYVEQGDPQNALLLYAKMQEQEVSPDARTFVSLFQACGILAGEEEDTACGRPTKVSSLENGRAIHADAQRKGCDGDAFVGSTLISMYGKCGSLAEARMVFNQLPQRDVVTWNSMLAVYIEQGQGDEALQLYRLMLQQGVTPNGITLVCILQACSDTGSLSNVREIHQSFVSSGRCLSPDLASILVSAYGRCASMIEAQSVFDALSQPTVASWNALIAGYARQGSCAASLQCYEEMQVAGIEPDGVTFISLLSACSHAGLVEKGVQCFESMTREHRLTPNIEHYVSMVDILGRAGYFRRVEDLLCTMQVQPSLSLWLCLLGACQKHGNVRLGEQAFDCAVRLHPKHSAPYVLMANIYSDAQLPDSAAKVMKLRRKEGAWKDPGQSWIEHDQEVHAFLVGDHNQVRQKKLYELVSQISLELK